MVGRRAATQDQTVGMVRHTVTLATTAGCHHRQPAFNEGNGLLSIRILLRRDFHVSPRSPVVSATRSLIRLGIDIRFGGGGH